MQKLLPLPHHAHVLIVQDENLDRQLVLYGGRHFLHRHQHRSIAGDIDDQAIGVRGLDPQCGGQVESVDSEAEYEEGYCCYEITKVPEGEYLFSPSCGQ